MDSCCQTSPGISQLVHNRLDFDPRDRFPHIHMAERKGVLHLLVSLTWLRLLPKRGSTLVPVAGWCRNLIPGLPWAPPALLRSIPAFPRAHWAGLQKRHRLSSKFESLFSKTELENATRMATAHTLSWGKLPIELGHMTVQKEFKFHYKVSADRVYLNQLGIYKISNNKRKRFGIFKVRGSENKMY